MFNINPKYIKIEYVIIPLTQGKMALVDPVDADLFQHKWYAYRQVNRYYAGRATKGDIRRQKILPLHRVILERKTERPLEKWEMCDHIDNNPLNNRRDNLRIANHSENAMNTRISPKNKSGYKGISWEKNAKKWRVQIAVKGKDIYLGLFPDLDDAKKAYADANKKYHGEFGRIE